MKRTPYLIVKQKKRIRMITHSPRQVDRKGEKYNNKYLG